MLLLGPVPLKSDKFDDTGDMGDMGGTVNEDNIADVSLVDLGIATEHLNGLECTTKNLGKTPRNEVYRKRHPRNSGLGGGGEHARHAQTLYADDGGHGRSNRTSG